MSTANKHTSIQSPSGSTWKVPTQLFIGGEWVDPVAGGSFETMNPSTGKTMCSISRADATDVDLAVKAARKAFKTTWGKKATPLTRAKAMFKLADLMDAHAQELAELESMDNGKPVWQARDFDIADAAGCIRYYAGCADKIEGRTIEQEEGVKTAYTRVEPLGVCAQLTAFNYSLLIQAWKMGPALAAGNCVIVKPSEFTPLTALRLAELSQEAGIPAGVINIVNGFGQDCGAALSEHNDIDKISFTGSTATGRRIAAASAATNLKKTTLELGGKSPVLVFESADLEQAANWIALGNIYNKGEDCTNSSRLYVQEGIYDKFMPLLIKNYATHKIGDPFKPDTFQGPQVNKAQLDKILAFIEAGKAEGAKLECGGKRWSDPAQPHLAEGYFVEPTIFSGTRKGMKIVDEEIFGPVIAVATFKTEEEGIALANDTPYGLGAGVFTTNLGEAMRVTTAIDAGTVWVNSYALLSNACPFGGFKQSGSGRELGLDAIKEYTQIKTVHMNWDEKLEWPLPNQ